MIDIGYLAAFLGGVLALLSPCSALLLPSFFAYAFDGRARLVQRTAVFALGLMTVLVPLGVGSSFASALFYGHREVLIVTAGWLIIALGLAQILGRGFSFGPAARLQARLAGRTGPLGVYGLGAAYGLAGFCSGPILGSVLTVAAAGGSPVRGALLLALYSVGMAAPLFVLALGWERLGVGRRRWLRGTPITVGRLELHTTSLISGILFIAVGALFLLFDGTAGLTGTLGLGVSTDQEYSAQQWALKLGALVPDRVLVVGLAVTALGVLALAERSRHRSRLRGGAAEDA